MMPSFKFTKMHGLGNDFVVMEMLTQPFPFTQEQIKILADRHRGIGFDQLLIVTKPFLPETDFGIRIFNADGAEAFQCGNGMRCVARFIQLNNLSNQAKFKISTPKNCYEVVLHNSDINVNMRKPLFSPADIPFQAVGQWDRVLDYSLEGFAINAVSMGNPHCVLFVDKLMDIDVNDVGKKLSTHPKFPERTNVEFVEIGDPHHINIRIYERGVGETQACGSGACAAVVVGRLRNLLAETVMVTMPGGQLEINWANEQADVWMKGEAIKVFDGEFNLE